MTEFFSKLFDTTDYPARWNCGTWTAGEGWLHIISDFATFGAYIAIPCVLVWLQYRRTDLIFPKVFWLFAAFIFSCGSVHLIEATIFWHPMYRLSGVAKAITAIASWACVFATIKIAPTAIRLPSLTHLNSQLQNEIDRHEQVTNLAASITDATQNSPEDNGPMLQAMAKQFRAQVAAIITLIDDGSALWHGVQNGIAVAQTRDTLPQNNGQTLELLQFSGSARSFEQLETPYGQIRNVAVISLITDGSVSGALIVGDRDSPLQENELELLYRLSRLVSPTVFTRQRLADAKAQRQLAEQRLDEARVELDRLAQISTLGEITAGIAHELNQPLTALINFSDAAHAMTQEPLNAESIAELSSLTEKTKQQATRAGEVLRSVRSIVEKTPRAVSSFDLVQLVQGTIDLLAEDFNKRKIDIQVDSNADQIDLKADPIQIQQLIVNLLRNALDAITIMDKPGRILVCLETTPEQVTLSVSDSGQGLQPEETDRLFAPFFTTRSFGLGLGLNICRSIVELHGGKITADNGKLGGAIFTATFPQN